MTELMTTGDEWVSEGEEQDSAERHVGGGVSPPLMEIAVSSIVVDSRWNCRGPYSEEEAQEAFERFCVEPMLHPPTVAPMGGGRYQLVSGFLRFEVIRRQGKPIHWFRIVEGSEMDLCLWNLAENTARHALRGYDLVERTWTLYNRGVTKERLAQACGCKIRYLNRLLFIRRCANPELYELFRRGHPGLTVSRMARLVGHESMDQMKEFRRSEEHLGRAVDIEQGFSDEAELAAESPVPSKPKGYSAPEPSGGRRRRRLPSRSRVRQLLDLHERAPSLNPEYRRGALALLRHLLDGEPLPEPVVHVSE